VVTESAMSHSWRPLFDHVTLRVRDLSWSRVFYEQALKPFGVRVVQSSQGPLGFATDDRGDVWIKEEPPTASPVHIAFTPRGRADVDAFQSQPCRQKGSTTDRPDCDLTMAPGIPRPSSSILTGTT